MGHCNGRCCRNSITASGCNCTCDVCDTDGGNYRRLLAAVGDEGVRVARHHSRDLAEALGWDTMTSWSVMLDMVRALVPLPGVIRSMRSKGGT